MGGLGGVAIKESARADSEKTDFPLIGHLCIDPNQRVALCGAEILGIPAFGDYIPCEECDRLWEEWTGEFA